MLLIIPQVNLQIQCNCNRNPTGFLKKLNLELEMSKHIQTHFEKAEQWTLCPPRHLNLLQSYTSSKCAIEAVIYICVCDIIHVYVYIHILNMYIIYICLSGTEKSIHETYLSRNENLPLVILNGLRSNGLLYEWYWDLAIHFNIYGHIYIIHVHINACIWYICIYVFVYVCMYSNIHGLHTPEAKGKI